MPGAPGVIHERRAALSPKHPVHVTLRVRRDVPDLRRHVFLPVLTDALRAGKECPGLRLCHYVIMGNHLHLALAYVLTNLKKHERQLYPGAPAPAARTVDAFSSGPWFEDWHVVPEGASRWRRGEPPVARPRTWLLRDGWKRAGHIAPG